MLKVKKHCLYCNSVIYGRADKRFCGDGCRSSHNNGKKKGSEDEVSVIRAILMRNRRVLSTVLKDGIETVKISKDKLSFMGFNFKYHTHHYKILAEKYFWFSFEYGFMESDDGSLILVRDYGENYLKKFG